MTKMPSQTQEKKERKSTQMRKMIQLLHVPYKLQSAKSTKKNSARQCHYQGVKN